MNRFTKWSIGAGFFLILFMVVSFFVVPPLLKPYLIEILSKPSTAT